jgi:hypothetical protein
MDLANEPASMIRLAPASMLCCVGLALGATSTASGQPAAPTDVPAPAPAPATAPAPAPAPAFAPVDVAVNEPTPARRVFALEWNPLALFIDRISVNLEIALADHHALLLAPFVFDTRTASFIDVRGDATIVRASQRFEGVGGEIGYRYYAGYGGLRGFFAGPSFILAGVKGTDGAGDQTTFMNYGVAIDVGWQALVAADWVVSLGGGGQYTFASKSIPDQQAPAAYYANSGLHPRALAALGYAF